MKKIIALFFVTNILTLKFSICFAQEYPPYFGEQSQNALYAIRTNIENWGIIKGIFAADAIAAQASKAVVRPDDDIYEALENAANPDELLEAIEVIQSINQMQLVQINDQINMLDIHDLNDEEEEFWDNFRKVFNDPKRAKDALSSGEPHLKTFDGLRYDFQTVGEFVLTKSIDRGFEVQTRQKIAGKSVSKNTAVAINLHNDTICIYLEDFPDKQSSIQMRINNQPIEIKKFPIRLYRGGRISFSKKSYIISWFTGEKVIVKDLGHLLDVIITVPDSKYHIYEGLLGNNNNDPKDDLKIKDGKTLSPEKSYFETTTAFSGTPLSAAKNKLVKAYQNKLNQDFGNSWRVTDKTSLFGYEPGKSTATFTNKSFPENNDGIANMTPQQKEDARKKCIEAGVKENAMHQCVYDYLMTNDNAYIKSAVVISDVNAFFNSLGLKTNLKLITPDKIGEKAVDEIKKSIFKRLK